MAEIQVDICVGDPIHIDLSAFKSWLAGFTVKEVARSQESKPDRTLQRLVQCSHHFQLSAMDVLMGEITDQFHAYNMLETWLVTVPPSLAVQSIIPIPPNLQQKLITLYFSFDEHYSVPRELIGRKLTGRLRSNLDDVAEKTGVNLKSCRRQFDNIRRVFRTVEDEPGNLVDNIRRAFQLPFDLANLYASIVFMANSKFEMGKKRLTYLSFLDFHACVEEMIAHWTVGAEGTGATKEVDAGINVDTDVDRMFLQELKDVRGIVEADSDTHRALALAYLHPRLPDHQISVLETHYKQLSKSVLKIAEGLVHKAEFKDFFSDLEEKFMEPCRQLEYSVEEIGHFLNAMLESSRQLDGLMRRKHMQLAYQKYLKIVLTCAQQFAKARRR
ncbi:acidic fibroblast growth factor intracellular-binding protein-like isoform X1 [Sycon ciliatum]|uniref:acidic fibroblast growth factor intracellular-binding protein-like isoform X1 n=1 Tax=Sycon ciliatum TaxID=27933 RepID=UPI0031F634EC